MLLSGIYNMLLCVCVYTSMSVCAHGSTGPESAHSLGVSMYVGGGHTDMVKKCASSGPDTKYGCLVTQNFTQINSNCITSLLQKGHLGPGEWGSAGLPFSHGLHMDPSEP